MGESFSIVEGFGQHSKRRDCELSIVGALFLLRDDGALLLQLRDEKPNLRHAGMWVPPGGHIEADESVEQGTRREFLEETDYLQFYVELNHLFQGLDIIYSELEQNHYKLVLR